ncbi:hypothetical protein, partial [Klebsiella quasipneumoniae]
LFSGSVAVLLPKDAPSLISAFTLAGKAKSEPLRDNAMTV